MSKWISTAKQMPKAMYGESNCVLTISSLGTMRVLYFDGGNWCHPTGEALETAGASPITHWMPLPLPPEDEQPAAQGKWFYGGQMEQNLKKCPLCGEEFDENADDYGFDIIIEGKQEHITEILLPNDEKIVGLCSQCLKAAAYGCARLMCG